MAVAAAAGDADDELIGQTIAERYRIISRLGAGGMGVAYRAWDERDGVPVVIKIPKKVFFADPRFAERFFREMRLLQGLRHKNIAPLADVGEHDGLPFVVLRFLPGGSLSNRRLRHENGRPKPNPAGMLHLWLPAVAEALDFVHSQGVVHRDVKPANIFFDAFWGAYLGDLGIAKIIEESDAFDKEHTLTATHMGIGTQEYMSPEQFTPKAAVDGRADQYALAVTVYEMLAGVRPFTGATSNLIVEVLTHPVPPLQAHRQDLPPSLCGAVHRGLAKSPPERFPTCREFAAAVLRDVPPMEDEPGVARLLCPKCANILKLPTEAAGRKGKCPKCQTRMKVAEDLGALWLLDEARRQKKAAIETNTAELDSEPEDAPFDEESEGGEEVFKPVSTTTPIERYHRKRQSHLPLRLALTLASIGLVSYLAWQLMAPKPKRKKIDVKPTVTATATVGEIKSADGKAKPRPPSEDENGPLAQALKAAPEETPDSGQLRQEPGRGGAPRPTTPGQGQGEPANSGEPDLPASGGMDPKKRPEGLPGMSYLAELPIQSRKSHFFHNKIPWETIGGKHYANTMHIHPEVGSGKSSLVFTIGGKYGELIGAVGILDSAKRAASPQVFRIVGDGKEMWKSAPTRDAGRGEAFRINVSGVKTLELHADSTGPRYGAHCVWIDPLLVRLAATDASPKADVDNSRINPNATWPVDAIVSVETGHAYKVFKDRLSWADAKTRCEQLGGHLVTISSSTEQAFVVDCIGKFSIQVDRRDGQPTAWEDKLWAGGTDQGAEGQWRWIDGTPWTFSAWILNQPDSDGNFLNLCPHIAGGWNDEGIAGGQIPPLMAGFICEWEPRIKQMPVAEGTPEQTTNTASEERGQPSDAVGGKQKSAKSAGQRNVSAIAADKLSAGESHAFVCLPNGRVVGWGQNDFGTLDIPAALSNAIAVAAGWKHVIALTEDGKVLAWGGNEWGQCDVPAGLSDVQSIRAAGGHSLALKKDGTVVAWGRMLRINRDAADEIPKTLGPCSAISAGFAHNLAVEQNGAVVAWGEATDYERPLKTGDVRSVSAESNCGIHCNSLITKKGQVLFWGNAAGIRSGFMAGLEPPLLPEDTKAVWAGLDALPGTGGGAILTEGGKLICWPFKSEAMASGGRAGPSPGRSPYTAANGSSEIIAVNIGPGQVVALTRDYKIRVWGGGRLRNVPPELN